MVILKVTGSKKNYEKLLLMLGASKDFKIIGTLSSGHNSKTIKLECVSPELFTDSSKDPKRKYNIRYAPRFYTLLEIIDKTDFTLLHISRNSVKILAINLEYELDTQEERVVVLNRPNVGHCESLMIDQSKCKFRFTGTDAILESLGFKDHRVKSLKDGGWLTIRQEGNDKYLLYNHINAGIPTKYASESTVQFLKDINMVEKVVINET